jgi:hypothetical protein
LHSFQVSTSFPVILTFGKHWNIDNRISAYGVYRDAEFRNGYLGRNWVKLGNPDQV